MDENTLIAKEDDMNENVLSAKCFFEYGNFDWNVLRRVSTKYETLKLSSSSLIRL